MMRMSGKSLLEQLVKHYENEILCGEDLQGNEKELFMDLVIQVSRYVNDIRYCSKKDCPCSPERSIERLYLVLERYIKGTKFSMYPIPFTTIEKIIKEGRLHGTS